MGSMEDRFLVAVKKYQEKDLKAAWSEFKTITDDDKGGELADDALYNLGIIAFEEQKFDVSEKCFLKVIQEYPEGTIADVGGFEHGKTAAKAYLGLMNCYLAMGKEAEAKDALAELNNYGESYVTVKKSFSSIGSELMESYESQKEEFEKNVG